MCCCTPGVVPAAAPDRTVGIPMATEHEQLIQLIRNHPSETLSALVPELALPPGPAVALTVDATQVSPVERRADLVLGFGNGGRKRAVIVEVQSRIDRRKRHTWPLYLVALRDKLRLPTCLVVLTLDPKVEFAARRPIPTGHPGFELRPIVLGPSRIPEDPEALSDDPFQAVLSVMAHGKGPRGLELAKTAIARLGEIDEEDRREYAPVVVRSLLPPMRALLEALMVSHPSYKGTFFEAYVDRGRAEGLAKGRQEGRQEGLQALAKVFLVVVADRWPVDHQEAVRIAVHGASLSGLTAAVQFVYTSEFSEPNHAKLLQLLMTP